MSFALPSSHFHYCGPARPRVVFVVADGESPTPAEFVRARPLVNDDAVAFEKRYLEPLGLARDRDVGVAWMDISQEGERALVRKLDELTPDAVVFLGLASTLTREDAIALPRFQRSNGVWKASFAEEARRKMRALRKSIDAKLDARERSVAPSLRPLPKAARPHDGDGISNAKTVTVHKALAPKRIVYGVVLDPYVVDLQGDWVPPESVEDTAHDFVAEHGYISYQHEGVADAELVQSFVEEYPTLNDREKAFAGLPHRATRRKYGADLVHSGAWVIGVRLSERLWSEYLAGNLNAFSIEGFGTRAPLDASEMPQVTFLDVEVIG